MNEREDGKEKNSLHVKQAGFHERQNWSQLATKTIVIASQKGGVGKTTTAVSLSHALAQRGKKILLVDLDTQAQCSTLLGMEKESGVLKWLTHEITDGEPLTPKLVSKWVRQTGRELLLLLPGNQRSDMAAGMVREADLNFPAHFKHCLDVLRALKPDYIVFDTKPSKGATQDVAVWNSDYVVIPVTLEFMAMEGAVAQYEILKGYMSHQWRGMLVGFLPTMLTGQIVMQDGRKVLNASSGLLRENFDLLVQKFGSDLILDPIHRISALSGSANYGSTIFEMHSDEYVRRGQDEYMHLARYIMSI